MYIAGKRVLLEDGDQLHELFMLIARKPGESEEFSAEWQWRDGPAFGNPSELVAPEGDDREAVAVITEKGDAALALCLLSMMRTEGDKDVQFNAIHKLVESLTLKAFTKGVEYGRENPAPQPRYAHCE